jgi:hypothetical protein
MLTFHIEPVLIHKVLNTVQTFFRSVSTEAIKSDLKLNDTLRHLRISIFVV